MLRSRKDIIKLTNKTNIRMLRYCVRYFYRRLQSLRSLFGSLFSLVLIAVWIYFNRSQNTAALHLCQVKFRNVQMIFRWDSDFNEIQKFTCEFQILPIEIKMVLKAVFQWCVFFFVRIRTECSEHVNSFIDAYWAHVRKLT